MYGRSSESIGHKFVTVLQSTGYIFFFCEIAPESRDHWRGVNDSNLTWMQSTDAGIRRMMSPRQNHIANALISARIQMTPRIFRYDMLMNTSPSETPGVNRQAYLCMGELMPMRGRAYLFRILSIRYNAMQDIPKGECSNWVALCRDYMRKYYNPWRKDRI
eukprot:10964280-Karenia_brevis.AAC.1